LTDNEWVSKETLNKDNLFTSIGIDDMYDKIVLCGADCSGYSDVIYYDVSKNKWVDCEYQIEHSFNSLIKTAVWKNEVFAAVCENDNSEVKIYKMELQGEIKGDVDRNGILTADDVAKALGCTLISETSLDDQQKELADMDGNGIITANDAALILFVSLYGK
jgi:hypothetical protein